MHYRALGTIHNTDRQAWFRTYFDTQAATDATRVDQRTIHVPVDKTDGAFAEWTDTDTGAADTLVNPWVTGSLVDLCGAHIDVMPRCHRQGVGRAELHTLVAQDTGLRRRVDVGGVGLVATTVPVKLDAGRWAHFTTQATADTGGIKGLIILQCTGRANTMTRIGTYLRGHQTR